MRFASAITCLLAAASLSAAPIVIDAFGTDQNQIQVGPGQPGNNPWTAGSGVAAPDAIGGSRNISITRVSGNGSDTADVGLTPGVFTLSTAAANNSVGRIIWDGDTNSSVNPTGLGGRDLTDGGTNTFLRLQARSDITGTIYITIFTSATAYSTVAITLPALGFGATPFTEYIIPFSSFTQGAPANVTSSTIGFNLGAASGSANFTNVGAITLFVDGTGAGSAGLDTQIRLLQADGPPPVPEPVTLLLSGVGLGFIGLLRRRQA